MGKIYVDATKARIVLVTYQDFSSDAPVTCAVAYRKPDGTEGEWVAYVDSGNLTTGRIYTDFTSDRCFDVVGTWRMWAKLTYSDSRVAYGDPVIYNVNSIGHIGH